MEEKIEALIGKTVEELGYELYDVIYEKEAQDYYLRIFIDTPEGISLDDCEKVNDGINDLLDEANCIKESYFLEVSSPGIERVLRRDKHLEQNIGVEINVKLFRKDENGQKEYIGILKSFTPEILTIEVSEKEIIIERKNIAQIKTVYNW